jgi:hypothetical protein
MDRHARSEVDGLEPRWLGALRAVVRSVGIDVEPMPVRTVWMTGAELTASVHSLGGTLHPASPFYGWHLAARPREEVEAISRFAPRLVGASLNADDFAGVAVLELDRERFIVLRTTEQVSPGMLERIQFLAGPSLEATLRLAAALQAARERLFRTRVRVFGTSVLPAAVPPVAEADLVLPDGLKRQLVEDVDAFWHAALLCAQMRIPRTRGLLFVGAPGTGKTLAIQHLLTRHAETQAYIFLPDGGVVPRASAAFRAMIQEMVAVGAPATVVLEDLDRLVTAGLVTLDLIRNVVDGLCRPPQPVLWIATANDPRTLEPGLLDRPGRFDRVFVFPIPAEADRVRLLRRFAPWPLDEPLIAELARHTNGLTGAHLREVCFAGALATAATGATTATARARALWAALTRVKAQHAWARTDGFDIERTPIGFGRPLRDHG